MNVKCLQTCDTELWQLEATTRSSKILSYSWVLFCLTASAYNALPFTLFSAILSNWREPEVMADQFDLRLKASEATGHAQVKKDELVDKAGSALQWVKHLHKTLKILEGIDNSGDQMKSAAQGAADAAKSAVGMGNNCNGSSTTTTRTTSFP